MKLGDEEVPSAETNSVEVGDSSPPKRRTSPEGRPQHKCLFLRSPRITGNSSNAEIPSNFSQDLYEGFPPQRKLLQNVDWIPLDFLISPVGQDWPVFELNSSVE